MPNDGRKFRDFVHQNPRHESSQSQLFFPLLFGFPITDLAFPTIAATITVLLFWPIERDVGDARAGESGCYGPDVTRDKLKDFHWHRLQVLVDAGPDMLAFETIPNKLEAQVFSSSNYAL